MHIKTRNVNTAFRELVEGIYSGKIPTHVTASRAGEVAVIEEPVIITYHSPRERVLFNSARDANPFFHLYEALWMLAGRNDVAPLTYYNSRIKDFSDDGITLNGAYGYRWRHAECSNNEPYYERHDEFKEYDQLDLLVAHLKAQPESRRAVLSMWNVEDDLLKIGHERCERCTLEAQAGLEPDGGSRCASCRWQSKDVCCNLNVMFSIQEGRCPYCDGKPLGCCDYCKGIPHDQPRYLNMTVTNRSNDLIWGALGANAVHFSILQEYIAAHLGLEVGVYNQISNNLHVYTERFDAEKWLEYYGAEEEVEYINECTMVPLVKDPAAFDRELPEFVERHSRDATAGVYSEPFLREVAQPMCIAFHYRKRREYNNALAVVDNVSADDWRIAAREWIERRKERYLAKQQTETR